MSYIAQSRARRIALSRQEKMRKQSLQMVEKSGSWDQVWLKSLESHFGGNKVNEPFKQHPTVYMALDSIATNLSATEYKLYRGGIEGDLVTKGPEVELFKRPNSRWCRFTLWEAIVINYFYTGEAFLYMEKSIGMESGARGALKLPSALCVFGRKQTQEIMKDGELVGWKIDNKQYELDEIIQFFKYNPFHKIRGFDPLMPIQKIIDLDFQAILFNKAFFENGAEMNGYLTSEKNIPADAQERILKELENRHKGPENSKRIGLLGGGLEYQPASENHKDMEFLDGRRYNREEILGLFHAPKSLFSITDDVNYATAQSQKKLFWENTIMPALRYLEETLNTWFWPRFSPDITGYFDLSQVPELQEDFDKKVANAKILFDMGYSRARINERLDMGFDNEPEDEIAFVPFNLVPLDQAIAPPEPQTALAPIAPDKPDKMPKTTQEENTKSIIKRQRKLLTHDAFLRSFSLFELRLEGRMKRYFQELKGDILSILDKLVLSEHEKSIGDLLRFQWIKQNEKIQKAIFPVVKQTLFNSQRILEASTGLKPDLNSLNDSFARYLGNHMTKTTRINETTRQQIDDIVRHGLLRGATVSEIKDGIKVYFNTTTARARMIARTEIVGASNAGAKLFMKDVGIEKKEWSTANDEAVRPTHQSLEGAVVGIDEEFKNGLQFPGDPSGEASEVINCRCVSLPVID